MARPLFVLLGLALAACGAGCASIERSEEREPTLPPPLPAIVTTPSLAGWVTQRLIAYRELRPAEPGESSYDALRLVVEVMPLEAAVEAARSGSVELVIAGSDPPDGWFAAPVGVEGVAVIVHPRNPVQELDLASLRGLFSGFIDEWHMILPSNGEVQPVIPLPGDEIRSLLEDSILEASRPSLRSLLGPSPEALVSLVAEHEGAIGLLPASHLDGTVRAVSVEGVPFSQDSLLAGRYPLRLELAAFAPHEPDGATRDWLVWLQEMRATPTP